MTWCTSDCPVFFKACLLPTVWNHRPINCWSTRGKAVHQHKTSPAKEVSWRCLFLHLHSWQQPWVLLPYSAVALTYLLLISRSLPCSWWDKCCSVVDTYTPSRFCTGSWNLVLVLCRNQNHVLLTGNDWVLSLSKASYRKTSDYQTTYSILILWSGGCGVCVLAHARVWLAQVWGPGN